MDRYQLLALAIESLERQKARIDAEMEEIRAELKGIGVRVPRVGSSRARKGRMATAAQRREHSEKMKKYWAAKKAQAKPAAEASKTMQSPTVSKTVPAASPKPRTKTEAQKKALSAAMKKAWMKRKA